jgi:hypothetical protein
MRPLATSLREVGKVGWGEGEGDLTNVQCKAIRNCHIESPLYNEYILTKMGRNESMVIAN